VLEGLGEFRIVNEVHRRSFREATVQWCPVANSELECDTEAMEALRELLLGYLGEPAHHAWRTLVGERGLHGGSLINFLCFHLDLTPLEKQTLLEAMSARVDRLFDVLTFKLEERKLGGPGGTRGGTETMQ
jgi:Lon protease-like protein